MGYVLLEEKKVTEGTSSVLQPQSIIPNILLLQTPTEAHRLNINNHFKSAYPVLKSDLLSNTF